MAATRARPTRCRNSRLLRGSDRARSEPFPGTGTPSRSNCCGFHLTEHSPLLARFRLTKTNGGGRRTTKLHKGQGAWLCTDLGPARGAFGTALPAFGNGRDNPNRTCGALRRGCRRPGLDAASTTARLYRSEGSAKRSVSGRALDGECELVDRAAMMAEYVTALHGQAGCPDPDPHQGQPWRRPAGR
jgi:hypothetical protein